MAHEITSPKNQPQFSLTTMRQYWLGKTKPKQAFRSTQNAFNKLLRIFIYLYYKSEKPSVCLSAFHLMSRIVLSNRCAFGSVFGVTEALIIELNNDAFEKFVRAIVSRLAAVEGRCVD